MLKDELFQFLGVGAAEAVNLLSLFDKNKCGHRCDVVLHGKLFAFVNVDLKN